ncbi:MAG TPA: hypothetical protein VLA52_16235 [Thermohalobaculum sp.]|nr:hypothetical protein [Thermohalobaculum sp.]
MKFTLKTAASAVALTMIMGTGSAFAKAHDQGVADGEPLEFPGGTGAFVQTLDQGVSSLQNGGQRGDTASANGGDNRVEPVVGANEPD